MEILTMEWLYAIDDHADILQGKEFVMEHDLPPANQRAHIATSEILNPVVCIYA